MPTCLSPAITQAQEEVDEAAAMTALHGSFRQAEIAADACKQQPSSGDRRQRRRKSLTAPRRRSDLSRPKKKSGNSTQHVRCGSHFELEIDTKQQSDEGRREQTNDDKTGQPLGDTFNTKACCQASRGRGGILHPVVSAARRAAATQPYRPTQPSGQRRFVAPAAIPSAALPLSASNAQYAQHEVSRRVRQRSPLRIGESARTVAPAAAPVPDA